MTEEVITLRTPKHVLALAQKIFVRVGVLPFLLVIAIIIFATLSDNYLTWRNMLNVSRQSTYLIIVAIGQMIVLLTGGFDLSVGSIIALTSVVSATVMSTVYGANNDAIALAILLGVLAGLVVGSFVGVLNGAGVALFGVSPFMMTLGMSSVAFGISLFMTGGVPVYGLPPQYSDIFGFGNLLNIPTPIWITLGIISISYLRLNWTKTGRYFYAVGGNIKASALSGINTRYILFHVYVLSAALASIAGLLLTARLETGEANIGASFPLESIAACVIGGVSLRGGVGRIENVVLGAIFIGLVQNGMNLARIESYLQIVVLGVLLIVAVIADQLRQRYVVILHD